MPVGLALCHRDAVLEVVSHSSNCESFRHWPVPAVILQRHHHGRVCGELGGQPEERAPHLSVRVNVRSEQIDNQAPTLNSMPVVRPVVDDFARSKSNLRSERGLHPQKVLLRL